MSQSARYVPSPCMLLSKSIGSNWVRSSGATAKNSTTTRETSKRLISCRHLWGVSTKSQYYSSTGTNWKLTKTIIKFTRSVPNYSPLWPTPGNLTCLSYPPVAVHFTMWAVVKPMPRPALGGGNRCLARYFHTYQGTITACGSVFQALCSQTKTRIIPLVLTILLPLVWHQQTERHGNNRTQTGLPPSHSTSARSFSGT